MNVVGINGMLFGRGIEQSTIRVNTDEAKKAVLTTGSLAECFDSKEAKKGSTKIISKRSFCAKALKSTACAGEFLGVVHKLRPISFLN